MKRCWIARGSVAVVVSFVAVVWCSEGGASTSLHRITSMSNGVIANRPAVYTLPPGCAPAGTKLQCNPLTNAGCDRTKDEACDDDERGGFGCYPGPNAVDEGGKCDDEEGCRGGLGCDMDDDDDDGVCARYCCKDSDCGTKKCVATNKAFGSLGFCN